MVVRSVLRIKFQTGRKRFFLAFFTHFLYYSCTVLHIITPKNCCWVLPNLPTVKNLPKNFISQYPHIPFKQIGRIRDKLINNYFGVDYRTVWKTIKNKLPQFCNTFILLHSSKRSYLLLFIFTNFFLYCFYYT